MAHGPQGSAAQFLPDKYPEFASASGRPQRVPAGPAVPPEPLGPLPQRRRGESWKDIAKGVPSDFGFAMAAHPHDPDTVYIVPLESDGFRCTPEGRLRVYRTRDAGKSWQPLTRGLPQKDALETVLRDALATDRFEKAGVYFGTRSGKVFASRDAGTSWAQVADGLPPVVCVKAAVVPKGRGR